MKSSFDHHYFSSDSVLQQCKLWPSYVGWLPLPLHWLTPLLFSTRSLPSSHPLPGMPGMFRNFWQTPWVVFCMFPGSPVLPRSLTVQICFRIALFASLSSNSTGLYMCLYVFPLCCATRPVPWARAAPTQLCWTSRRQAATRSASAEAPSWMPKNSTRTPRWPGRSSSTFQSSAWRPMKKVCRRCQFSANPPLAHVSLTEGECIILCSLCAFSPVTEVGLIQVPESDSLQSSIISVNW